VALFYTCFIQFEISEGQEQEEKLRASRL